MDKTPFTWEQMRGLIAQDLINNPSYSYTTTGIQYVTSIGFKIRLSPGKEGFSYKGKEYTKEELPNLVANEYMYWVRVGEDFELEFSI